MKKIKNLVIVFLGLLSCTCTKDTADPSGSYVTGQSGSLARFGLNGDYLYTVDKNALRIFDVSNASNPSFIKKTGNLVAAETIFIRDDTTMFIGSQEGMYIYDIENAENPLKISVYNHILSCDPVVADDKYAFVTLRQNSGCRFGLDQLEIIDISNLYSPYQVKTYPMAEPKGLAIESNRLYVCDEGIKVFDRTDVNNLVYLDGFSVLANDVIAYHDTLHVVANDGYYQYVYSSGNLDLLSKVTF